MEILLCSSSQWGVEHGPGIRCHLHVHGLFVHINTSILLQMEMAPLPGNLLFTRWSDACGHEKYRIPHLSSLPNPLVTGIHVQVHDLCKRSFPTLMQHCVQLCHCPADLYGRDLNPAKLSGDRFDLSGLDTLNIHLSACDHQCPLTSQALFQRRRLKATFSHLGYFKGDLSHACLDGLGFVPVGMACPIFSKIYYGGFLYRPQVVFGDFFLK